MDTTDGSLIFYGFAVVIVLVWSIGAIVLLGVAWEILTDWVTRDRSQPYWRRQRGPRSPLSGGRKAR